MIMTTKTMTTTMIDHWSGPADIQGSKQFRDGKMFGRCGRVRAIFFLANLLAVHAQTS